MAGPGDVVFSDAKNHASLWDGCRLSRADVRAYPHADWRQLDALLARASGYRRRLIVTDSLFSMDGDLAPLVELAEVARRHEAMLLVDEAHATGVFGAGGRGVAEHLGVEEAVTARVGTLSKALGCAGGFISGSRLLIEWLVNRARSYIYSTAAPAAISAAALAALEIVIAEPQRRRELLQRAAALRAATRGARLVAGTHRPARSSRSWSANRSGPWSFPNGCASKVCWCPPFALPPCLKARPVCGSA